MYIFLFICVLKNVHHFNYGLYILIYIINMGLFQHKFNFCGPYLSPMLVLFATGFHKCYLQNE